MREGLVISSLVHVAVIIAAGLTWPHMIERVNVEPTMSVELVPTADQSRAPKPSKPEPRPAAEPAPVEPPPEPQKIETPPPAEVKPLLPPPPPTQDVVKLKTEMPPPPTAPIKPAVRMQETPKLTKVDLKQTLPEPPKERPKPKVPDKKPDTLDLSKIASALNKLDKKPDTPAKPQTRCRRCRGCQRSGRR